MSAKITVIIGDYSNGWSDSILVQQVAKFNQKACDADRQFVTTVLSEALLSIIEKLEANESINPKPKDEPCCDAFKDWAKNQFEDSTVAFCPFCRVEISPERKSKYFTSVSV